MKNNKNLKVSIVMGSQSDYKTMKLAEKVLKILGVNFETKIISYGEDSTGQIIEGNKDSPQVIKDIWVFQKPLKTI